MGQWDKFKEEIRKQKTTQEWVANRVGMSLNTLQGKISKDREPLLSEALAFASILSTPVERLFPELAPNSTLEGISWEMNHQDLLRNLRSLTPEHLQAVAIQVEALAQLDRGSLGKSSHSTQAG